MDETDFTLLAGLVREPLASVAALARAAGVTMNTARARLERLREEGVLMGTYAFPNPALFGGVSKLAVYAPPAPEARAADTMRAAPVYSYSVNHDGQVAVTWLARDPDEAPPAEVDRLMGAPAPRTFVRESPPLNPKGAVLSADQWRLAEALAEDARAPDRALAQRVGLGERAVARQRERLVQGGFVTLVTGVLSCLADGVVVFHLYAQGPGTRDERALRAAVGWCGYLERIDAPVGAFLFCRADTLGGAL
ncbi:MAG TPA: AsnC family transcriptional regulator, partial [Candidatus Thermoplasmatota archaeon]|nr:AsnC family transcriptional regulator [Candidatus Thermoplasmatota archaeon]